MKLSSCWISAALLSGKVILVWCFSIKWSDSNITWNTGEQWDKMERWTKNFLPSTCKTKSTDWVKSQNCLLVLYGERNTLMFLKTKQIWSNSLLLLRFLVILTCYLDVFIVKKKLVHLLTSFIAQKIHCCYNFLSTQDEANLSESVKSKFIG